MSKQTTVQVPESIRLGSVRVLVGDDAASLVDVGALRNPVFNSLAETQSIEFDNVDPLKKFVKGDQVQVTFDLGEINFDNLAELNGGLINLSSVAASPVTVTAEAHGTGWTQGQPIRVNKKNGANTAVSTLVVKSGASTLTAGTDYRTYVGDGSNGELGYTYVVPLTTQSGAITFGYSYTPNASNRITFNSSGSSVLKYMRLINTDASGKEFRIDIENGTNFAPISVDFAGDEEDDVAILPVDFQGTIVEWVDEQAV